MERIFIVMTELVECVRAELTRSRLPVPSDLGVIPGAVVIGDYVGDESGDDCGLGWVRLTNAYPSEAVGQQALTVGNCNKGVGYELEVGLLRCVDGSGEDGIPSMTERTAAVGLQVSDMAAMHRAIACCTALAPKDQIVTNYTPMGPEGGLVGGMWTVFAGL